MTTSRRIEIAVALIAAIAAAFVLAGCGGPSGAPSAARTSAPPSAAATAAADPCAAMATWRGAAALGKVGRAMDAISRDETNGDAAALNGDGERLFTAATAAQASPPPIGRGEYLKALRLAAKAAVFAQSGNYQASSDAVVESGDLFSAITSELKKRCG